MRRMALIAGAFALGAVLTGSALGVAQDETALDKTMKRAGPAFGAIRKATEAMAADTVKESATVLTQVFADTEVFFKTRNNKEATGWAQDAATIAQTLVAQAGKADWEGIKKTSTDLQAACATCHATYREKGPDGFRLKAGN